VYADTSVFGGVFDEEFRDTSRTFFEQVREGKFSLVTSALVHEQIDPGPPDVQRFFADMLRFMDVAEEMYRRLQSIDEESKDARDPKDRTQYAKRFPFERCLEIVKASAKRAKIRTGRIIEENRQKILQALGPLQRKSAKRVIYKLTPNVLQTFSTKERSAISVSAADLRRGDKTVFFTPNTEKTLPDEQRDFFDVVKDQDGDYRMGSKTILNSYDFKMPCNMAIADWTPERRFIGLLYERDNAQVIEG
jgi:type III restriction enzyme